MALCVKPARLTCPSETLMFCNEMKELQFIKIEWARGEEFIHPVHHCNWPYEFHASTGTRETGCERKNMANRNDRTRGNAPGAWYVDSTCIDCDLCRETAAGLFNRNDETGFSVVVRQPVTPEEISLAAGALDGCPTESIGRDGVA